MSSSVSAATPLRALSKARMAKAAALAIILLVAIHFVWKYVFRYYLPFNPSNLGDSWPERLVFLAHITCGTVAIISGPFQFSSRLRQRNLQFHRVLGRVYLVAVALGSAAGILLAISSRAGWAWKIGVDSLNLAWIVTSGMAFYTIRQRLVAQHKDWMVRSYIVTFSFAVYRILFEAGNYWHIQPHYDWSVTTIWGCWAVPLLLAEAVMQLNHMHKTATR